MPYSIISLYVYLIHTIVIELYPLYQTLEGPSMYLPTHKATNTMPSIEQWYRSKYDIYRHRKLSDTILSTEQW